ncbi:MAG TPA: hypothetical protein PLT75_09680 [Spirochaetota bacterium]|nr:hypothetical protein [Spirochaetota bacterium]
MDNNTENIQDRLARYDSIMMNVGMKILEAGTILDMLIKEILLTRTDHSIDVSAAIPVRKGAGFTMITAKRVSYNPDYSSVDLHLEENDKIFSWNELDISAKDLILNTIVLALSSEDLYNQFRNQQ